MGDRQISLATSLWQPAFEERIDKKQAMKCFYILNNLDEAAKAPAYPRQAPQRCLYGRVPGATAARIATKLFSVS